jgi:hypothetical protein
MKTNKHKNTTTYVKWCFYLPIFLIFLSLQSMAQLEVGIGGETKEYVTGAGDNISLDLINKTGVTVNDISVHVESNPIRFIHSMNVVNIQSGIDDNDNGEWDIGEAMDPSVADSASTSIRMMLTHHRKIEPNQTVNVTLDFSDALPPGTKVTFRFSSDQILPIGHLDLMAEKDVGLSGSDNCVTIERQAGRRQLFYLTNNCGEDATDVDVSLRHPDDNVALPDIEIAHLRNGKVDDDRNKKIQSEDPDNPGVYTYEPSEGDDVLSSPDSKVKVILDKNGDPKTIKNGETVPIGLVLSDSIPPGTQFCFYFSKEINGEHRSMAVECDITQEDADHQYPFPVDIQSGVFPLRNQMPGSLELLSVTIPSEYQVHELNLAPPFENSDVQQCDANRFLVHVNPPLNSGEKAELLIYLTDYVQDHGEILILRAGDDAGCSCADPLACNYDPTDLNVDNCLFSDACGHCGGSGTLQGCMDQGACNYNSLADCDDGSCSFPGCTDPLSCNYDPNAGCDSGMCNVLDACGNCGGDGFEAGCPDPNACNFDPAADCDDGSCDYSCVGCTDFLACNYNPSATTDDGSCCLDMCVELRMYDDYGDGWNGAGFIISDAVSQTILYEGGLLVGSEENQMLCLMDGCYVIDVGGGHYDEEIAWEIDLGYTIVSGNELVTSANFSVGSFECASCKDPLACNYDGALPLHDFNLCEYSSCAGCTYPGAENYDPTATIEDGSCEFASCGGTEESPISIVSEVFYTDDGTVAGYPVGFTTYRIYAEMEDAADFLVGGFAFDNDLLSIGSSTNTIWNNGFGSETGDGIDPGFFLFDPSMEYDSFVTIGRASSADPGGDITALSTNPVGAFADHFGTTAPGVNEMSSNFSCSDGSWLTLSMEPNGYGIGPDNRILLAQVTTDGELEYNLNLQYISASDPLTQVNVVGDCATVDSPELNGSCSGFHYPEDALCCGAQVAGCTYPDAENYDDLATLDDGSCTFELASTCPQDLNGDGEVNTLDLLSFLGVFGMWCEDDWNW